MSRIGKKPIDVPASVKVSIDTKANAIHVEGPKGKLEYSWHTFVSVSWNEDEKKIICSIPEDMLGNRKVRAQWGTTRARIQNMITGVVDGYSKRMEIIGVGWNAKPLGKQIQLNIGFCHPVNMTPPPGVEFAIEKTFITITGIDKHLVGQFAANIRANRPPEPYKGKGIRYVGEYVIRKQGKVFGA
ncbi:MAG: 50S ribosomal protein L6 [Planctomycetota bacterium]|nr:50S ribosomal protein L6 [Planctomycetota bacterium]